MASYGVGVPYVSPHRGHPQDGLHRSGGAMFLRTFGVPPLGGSRRSYTQTAPEPPKDGTPNLRPSCHITMATTSSLHQHPPHDNPPAM